MTKTEKLLAAYESFGTAIAGISDAVAQSVRRTSENACRLVAEARAKAPHIATSALNAGLEQGLREMPMLIQEVQAESRRAVAQAFHDALTSHCPEFLHREAEKLKKVLARGKIRSEVEFYRVRHEIDVLEGERNQVSKLKALYALVDAYEARP